MDADTAQTHLDAWLAAELAVTSGQAYSIDTVAVTRVDIGRIRNQITYWQRIVDNYAATTAGGKSVAALATFGARS